MAYRTLLNFQHIGILALGNVLSFWLLEMAGMIAFWVFGFLGRWVYDIVSFVLAFDFFWFFSISFFF